MKKLLILALISLFSFEIKANDTISVVSDIKSTIVKGDTASLSKQIYTDFKSGIEAAGSALKVGATHVYGVLIKQQIVKSVIYLILLIGGFIWLTITINKFVKTTTDDWDDPTILNISIVLFFVFSFICVILGLFHISTIITGFVNPEYGAMQDIINFVK